MTAAWKRKRTTLYSVYCFVVLIAGCICRTVKRIGNGKCGKLGQAVFSLLAFLSLIGTILLCAAWEAESISWLPAIFGAGSGLLGFGLFAGMAGAFRPYRYMKKKQRRAGRGRMMRIPAQTARVRKISA